MRGGEKRLVLVVSVVVAILGAAGAALGVAPPLLHYQGYLADKDGVPVEGEWVVGFKLYETKTGTVPMFQESQTVKPTHGVFTIILGANQNNPLPTQPFQDGEVWLAIEVNGADGPVELTPRERVLSSPYSLFSGHAQVCEQATNALSLGGKSAGSYLLMTQIDQLCVAPDKLPALVEQYGITDKELPLLLAELGYKPGIDSDAMLAWLLKNGYLPGPYFSGQYADLAGKPDLAQYATKTMLQGYCQTPCYSDANVAAYLEINGFTPCSACFTDQKIQAYLDKQGYLPKGLLILRDGSQALKGNWDISGNELLNLVVHNAATDKAPANPKAGQLWWDTTQEILKVFDGAIWQAAGTGGGPAEVATDLQCKGCVSENEVAFPWAMGDAPGGAALTSLSVQCAGCIKPANLSLPYAGATAPGGPALVAEDLACTACVAAEETSFNWAVSNKPGGVALLAEQAYDADTVDGQHASQFEKAGAVAGHESKTPHLTAEQHQALTGGGVTTLHSHPVQAQGESNAKVRTQKGDYNVRGGKGAVDYIHVLSSKAPKVYLYAYGDVPVEEILPNHTHGAHTHTVPSSTQYSGSNCTSNPCTKTSSSVSIGTGTYPLVDLAATTIPKNVQIWLDGTNVTAKIGDQNQMGSPHWDAAGKTWGAGTTAWKTGRLDISNAIVWGVGEHKLELRETAGTGGRILYYIYIVHPAGQSSPLPNDECGGAQAIQFTAGSAVVKGTTEDMLGENSALDNLAPAGCGGKGGGDVVYSLSLTKRSVVAASIQSVFTPRIYLLSSPCSEQKVVSSGCGLATMETDELDPGTYYLVVDSDSAAQKGDFILNVQIIDAPLPAHDTCETAQAIQPGANPIVVNGTSKFALDQYSGTCGGTGAADVVYSFQSTDLLDDLSVTLSGGFASRMYLRASDCKAGFQVSCSSTGTLAVNGLTPGTYYLFIDGAAKADEGPFSITVSLK